MDSGIVTQLLINALASAIAIAALLGGILVVSFRTRNWSIVDTFWGLSFVLVAAVSFVLSAGHGDSARRMLVLAATALWGLRLAGYLHWRNRGGPEDPRYTKLMSRNQGSVVRYAIRTIYWPQGRTMWLVSLPIQGAMYQDAALNVWAWMGLALVIFGVGFEAVGDAQLARFKADPANRGQIMTRGLWSWTRHPNYFGDSCVMFGLWLLACGHWAGIVLVICPILMTQHLIQGSGKALTERRMTRKYGQKYEDYLAHTSGFLPRPPVPTSRRQP